MTFSDGWKYAISAHYIALDKAQYFATQDCGEFCTDNKASWIEAEEKEYADCLSDASELLDWANNNMDWDYLSEFAKLLNYAKPEESYEDQWANAEKEVREVAD